LFHVEHQSHTVSICPSCENGHFEFSHESIDHTVSKKSFTVVSCTNCALLITSPRPSLEKLGDYYKSEDYVSHSESTAGFINSVYHRVRKRTIRQKVAMVQSLNGSNSILDYGAGTGRFLLACKNAGLEVRGAEPDVDALSNTDREIRKFIGSPEQVLAEKQTFDTITLWHVLEHIPNLSEILLQLRSKLKPNGRLVIAVPNHTSHDANHYGAHWAAWDVPRHLWHFSPESMDYLMTRTGFKVIDRKPMWYDSVYVSLLSEKNKGGGKVGIVRAAFVGLYSNLKHFFSKKAKSSSTIYIIKAVDAI